MIEVARQIAGQSERSDPKSLPALWHRFSRFLLRTIHSVSLKRRTSSLRLQESLALGERRSLIVVHWENRRYLIGLTPQAVQLLDSCSEAVDQVKDPATGHSRRP
jgi:flagellar biogenesis protein FliO